MSNTSVIAAGTVTGGITGPGAGSTLINAVTIPAAGQYQVTVSVTLGGTSTAADQNNVKVTQGAVTVQVPNLSSGFMTVRWVMNFDGVNTIRVQVNTAGGAAAVYSAFIEVRQLADWESESE